MIIVTWCLSWQPVIDPSVILKVAERDDSGEKLFRLILDEPDQLDEFLTAVQGRRLVRTYGTFRGMVVGDEESPQDGETCPDCGSNCIVDLGFVPPQQVSFDFEKNCLRVIRSPGETAVLLTSLVQFNPRWEESEISYRRRQIARMHEGKIEAQLRRSRQPVARTSQVRPL